MCVHGRDVSVMNCTYLVPGDGSYCLYDGQGHQMLDKRNPLSQRGSQRDADQQGGKGASQGAQPSILSPPWNTSPVRKMASLNCEQTEVHMMPENTWRAQKRKRRMCAAGTSPDWWKCLEILGLTQQQRSCLKSAPWLNKFLIISIMFCLISSMLWWFKVLHSVWTSLGLILTTWQCRQKWRQWGNWTEPTLIQERSWKPCFSEVIPTVMVSQNHRTVHF